MHGLNQMEIRGGKMAETHSQTKAVRDYGAMLVKDHQAADKKLLAYAKERKIDPKAMTTALAGAQEQYHAQLDRLGQLQGATFDRAFATAMMDGHSNAIGTIERARLGITDPKLNALVGDMLPMLHKHQHMAAELTAQKPTAATPGATTPTVQGARPPVVH
jgi:putative membrane protein